MSPPNPAALSPGFLARNPRAGFLSRGEYEDRQKVCTAEQVPRLLTSPEFKAWGDRLRKSAGLVPPAPTAPATTSWSTLLLILYVGATTALLLWESSIGPRAFSTLHDGRGGHNGTIGHISASGYSQVVTGHAEASMTNSVQSSLRHLETSLASSLEMAIKQNAALNDRLQALEDASHKAQSVTPAGLWMLVAVLSAGAIALCLLPSIKLDRQLESNSGIGSSAVALSTGSTVLEKRVQDLERLARKKSASQDSALRRLEKHLRSALQRVRHDVRSLSKPVRSLEVEIVAAIKKGASEQEVEELVSRRDEALLLKDVAHTRGLQLLENSVGRFIDVARVEMEAPSHPKSKPYSLRPSKGNRSHDSIDASQSLDASQELESHQGLHFMDSARVALSGLPAAAVSAASVVSSLAAVPVREWPILPIAAVAGKAMHTVNKSLQWLCGTKAHSTGGSPTRLVSHALRDISPPTPARPERMAGHHGLHLPPQSRHPLSQSMPNSMIRKRVSY